MSCISYYEQDGEFLFLDGGGYGCPRIIKYLGVKVQINRFMAHTEKATVCDIPEPKVYPSSNHFENYLFPLEPKLAFTIPEYPKHSHSFDNREILLVDDLCEIGYARNRARANGTRLRALVG